MSVIVVLLGVLSSAVLLALDSKRRTEQISYWRVIIAVAITFFGAGSQAGQTHVPGTAYNPLDFLASYAGMLAFFWFVIIRPRKLVDIIFRKGSSLLKKGETQQALALFNQALDKAKSKNEKGSILYNIAVCNLRLGQRETAIRALADTVCVVPSLKSRIAKDKDFTELQNDEQFCVVIAKG